jgi:hypothetical protein
MGFIPSDDSESLERTREFMGPGEVDDMVRQAVQTAWTALAKEKRTLAEVERVVRRLVDRAFEDFREDKELISPHG